MRGTVLGVLAALAFGGSALAADFVVVASSDPAIKKGAALDAGAKVALAPGATLTIMRPSGQITTLRGAPGGVTVPAMRVAAADSAKFEGLKALLQPPPEGRTFGARRGGICPPVETLTQLEDILRVADQAGCKTVARQALDAYIAKQPQQ
jgi:hypothetical protein